MCFPKAPKPIKPPAPPSVSKLQTDTLKRRQAAGGFGSQQTKTGAGSLPGANSFTPSGSTILGSG